MLVNREFFGWVLRALSRLILFSVVLGPAAADPFPMPMAEERRGGLLYFPFVPSGGSESSALNKKHHGHEELVFESIGVDSDVLDDAFDRYREIFRTPGMHLAYEWEVSAPEELLEDTNRVRRVLVYVQNSDQSLDLYTDESYSIRISSPDVTIEAQTVYGALRALETLSQSTHVLEVTDNRSSGNDDDPHKLLVLNETALYDSPRFRHRGMLLDTSLHFLPIDVIKQHLDAMTMVKLNVLHWRINGDTSWPFVSTSVPELSAAGAFSPTRQYDEDKIQEVVTYGRRRGVRVVVEFNTPAHTGSIGMSHPELVVPCVDDHHDYPILNPATNATYDILWNVIRDAGRVFPDRAMHFGGDDLDRTACWGASEEVMRAFGDVHDALMAHTQRLMEFAAAMGKVPIVYEGIWEAQEHTSKRYGIVLPPTAVVQILTGTSQWQKLADALTKKSARIVLSAPWHVDSALSPNAWKTFWSVEPLDFGKRPSLEQQDLVLGGEVVVRSELIDMTNSISRTWPLAATTAERLWSQESVTDVADAEQRLFRLRCRMVARGVRAAPMSLSWGACPFVEEPDHEQVIYVT